MKKIANSPSLASFMDDQYSLISLSDNEQDSIDVLSSFHNLLYNQPKNILKNK